MRINSYLAQMNKAYLFAEIAAKVSEYAAQHPDQEIIKLGIGDVTRPLTPHVAKAFADAALAMGTPEGFHGYPPYEGYDFLLDAIIRQEYAPLGVTLGRDEVFVSDGAKTDTGNIQELLAPDARVAVFRSQSDNACLRCDYRGACRFQEGRGGEKSRYLPKYSPEEVWALMEEGETNG